MVKTLIKTISKSWQAQVAVPFFVVLSVWWLSIYARGLKEGLENDAFTLIYPVASLWGAMWGFIIARKWGGLKSLLGKVLFFLSLGLLFQFFGQVAYAYYIYILGIEVPYPSIGDIGYFGSIVFYIYGVLNLGRVVGAHLVSRTLRGRAMAVLIPLALLVFSYLFFLRGYEFDWSAPLTVLLDFGYPLGQAIYVSLAISAFILSKKFLGGIMKGPMLFLIFSLVVQYFCDYMFLFQANRGLWYVGGVNDYLYFLSYTMMTIGLIQLGYMFKSLKEERGIDKNS